MPVSKNKKIKKDSTKKIPKRKAKSTKKSPAKKTIRKKAEKKTSKKVEADIKKAVDKLPGLIVEQIKFEQPFVEKQYAPIKKEFTDSRNHSKRDNGKRKLLWLFVLAITTIIFTMWIWNVTVFFKDTNRLRKTEAGLFDSAKETYNEIISQDIENTRKILEKKT